MVSKLSGATQVVVVTYNPEIKLLRRNLNSILRQFVRVLIVDNASANIAEIERLIIGLKKVELKRLTENYGIAYAQNIGLKLAAERKMIWLLTMDQDSIIPSNLSSEYEKVLRSHRHAGLVGWNQHSDNKNNGDGIREDWFILSSGCLMNVRALRECGGFDERLFIDHVDTDANIKIRNLGYRTLTTNAVKLAHQLGTQTDHKTLRGKIHIAHSPIRIYYNVRNGVVLLKRYSIKQPRWMVNALLSNFREGAYLLLYQPKRFTNFCLLTRAWFDGITDRLGKYKP